MSIATNIPKPIRILAGCALLFLGGLFTALALFLGIRGMGAEMIRQVVPGETEIVLEQPGAYTVFYEYRSKIDGQPIYSPKKAPRIVCSLEGVSSDLSIPMEPTKANSNYSVGAYAAYSIGVLRVPEPGAYRLVVSYRKGSADRMTVVALSRHFGRRLTALILIVVAIDIPTLLGAIFLFTGKLQTKIRPRRRAKKPPQERTG